MIPAKVTLTHCCLLLGTLLLLFSCRKEVTYPNGAPGQLPPETQQGLNTFGCKLNGEVWKPEGKTTGPGNRDLSYDPTWNGGTMSIQTYRYTDSSNISIMEAINIGISQLSKEGIYSLNTEAQNGVADLMLTKNHKTTKDNLLFCFYHQDNVERTGTLTITKIDLQKGFISGRFEFTLTRKEAATGCLSTIRVTEGRFDLKI